MKFKIISFFFFLAFLFPSQSHASIKSTSQIGQTEICVANRLEQNENTTSLSKTRRSGQTNGQIAFATRTGFILLRKEEIISLSVSKLYGGLMLQYWQSGIVKSVHCQSTITKAIERLGDFPFVKVSRSSIVNMDEVSEYVGSKRNAHLVMRNETTVKVSRNKAEDIYAWFKEVSVS